MASINSLLDQKKNLRVLPEEMHYTDKDLNAPIVNVVLIGTTDWLVYYKDEEKGLTQLISVEPGGYANVKCIDLVNFSEFNQLPLFKSIEGSVMQSRLEHYIKSEMVILNNTATVEKLELKLQ